MKRDINKQAERRKEANRDVEYTYDAVVAEKIEKATAATIDGIIFNY